MLMISGRMNIHSPSLCLLSAEKFAFVAGVVGCLPTAHFNCAGFLSCSLYAQYRRFLSLCR